MLSSSKIVGFVPTKHSLKARAFYEGKLGFQFVSDDQFALVVRAGETTIRVAKAQDFTPAPYTVLGWEVQDIEAMVAWLTRGEWPSKNIRSFRIANLESGRRPAATRWHGSRMQTGTCFPFISTSSRKRTAVAILAKIFHVEENVE